MGLLQLSVVIRTWALIANEIDAFLSKNGHPIRKWNHKGLIVMNYLCQNTTWTIITWSYKEMQRQWIDGMLPRFGPGIDRMDRSTQVIYCAWTCGAGRLTPLMLRHIRADSPAGYGLGILIMTFSALQPRQAPQFSALPAGCVLSAHSRALFLAYPSHTDWTGLYCSLCVNGMHRRFRRSICRNFFAASVLCGELSGDFVKCCTCRTGGSIRGGLRVGW